MRLGRNEQRLRGRGARCRSRRRARGRCVWCQRQSPTRVSACGPSSNASCPRLPAGKVALLPNLKTVPPYEFGFVAPANPLNAVYPPDTVNPPLDVAGIHPLSCAADEMAPVAAGGGGATKCLRLTSGPINVGSGPFEMLFDFATDTSAARSTPSLLQGPMRQVIHYSRRHHHGAASGHLFVPQDPRALPHRPGADLRVVPRRRRGRRAASPDRRRHQVAGSARPTSCSATGTASRRCRRAPSARVTPLAGRCCFSPEGGRSVSASAGATCTAGSARVSTSSSAASPTGSTSCARRRTSTTTCSRRTRTTTASYASSR